MIESEELAGALSTRLLAIFQELEDTVRVVANEAASKDVQRYRQAVGRVCGALVLDVLGPLYEAHPQIKPASWLEAEAAESDSTPG